MILLTNRLNEIVSSSALWAAEHGLVSDGAIRTGIRRLNQERATREHQLLANDPERYYQRFVREMDAAEIALVPDRANDQHYEVPAQFYERVLGARRKYSSCLFTSANDSLDDAEEHALSETCKHAGLKDGMRILELGCGWGSLTLWMAEKYPDAKITGVSNSHSQRNHIVEQARARGLSNVAIITQDMNDFTPVGRFDRVVSVEMFEHMRNYRKLLRRISNWLTPEGRLFVHIFTHQRFLYEFESEGANNWMGRHFFSGGIMPSANIFELFDDVVSVEKSWAWSGTHYQKTAEAWLANLDDLAEELKPIVSRCYRTNAPGKWIQRWRMFFMACSELFGAHGGSEWGVNHYLLKPVR